MCRIWKGFFQPCILHSYIFSSRSLPGNVKAALCVSLLHLGAICDLNCMPFFHLVSAVNNACINRSIFRTQLPPLSVAEFRSIFQQGNKNDRLKGFQWYTHKNWRYPRKSKFTATEGLTDVPVVVLGLSVATVRP
jgi:hypothetical protein